MYLFKIICSTELVVVRSVLLDMRIQGNSYVRSILIAIRMLDTECPQGSCSFIYTGRGSTGKLKFDFES